MLIIAILYTATYTAYTHIFGVVDVNDGCPINFIAENVVSEFLIMPRTFVTFVPVVKNKCVN